MNETNTNNDAARDAGQMIDIYATGGTAFCVRLIENYDPKTSIAVQDGKFLGNTEFGEIDSEGQYEGDDDEIIEHVREEFDLAEEIPAKVR